VERWNDETVNTDVVILSTTPRLRTQIILKMSSTKLNLIVAACENMGIGIEGQLPWRLKQDMAFFKKITLETKDNSKKNAVIMGRKTWESIPSKFRPLSNRINIVMSRQTTDKPDGALLANSFEEAMRIASSKTEVETIFVIGGASIYKESIESSYPCRVYLTRIHKHFKCDTFFPEMDPSVFKKIQNPESIPSDEQIELDVKFTFEIYEKD